MSFSLSPVIVFYLKSIFFWYKYHPFSLLVIICIDCLSHHFTFNLFTSLYLKWVSYRWHTVGSCSVLFFLIYSATLYYLIVEFNLFIFIVITGRNGLTTSILFLICARVIFFLLFLFCCLPLLIIFVVITFDWFLISFCISFIVLCVVITGIAENIL